MKKLTRARTDKVIGGVLGGFAEYINVDPTVVRLGYILLTLVTCFSGILFYLIAWVVIPKNVSHETKNHHDHSHAHNKDAEEKSDVSQEASE